MWTPGLITTGLIIFLILVFLEVPIAFSVGFSSIVLLLIQGSFPLTFFAQRIIVGLNSFPLLALPLFIFVGQAMNLSGVTDDLFKFVRCIIGRIKGSTAYANILVSVIFAGMSGSATADAAGLGLVEMKAMADEGFDTEFAAAVTAASSTIGPIIPPSIPLIIYGYMSNTSIGRLFIAGLLPGILMAIALAILVYIMLLKKTNISRGEKYSLKEILQITLKSLPALFTPILLLGGIIFGIFTPTEAAGVASVYTLFLGFVVYKELTINKLIVILKNTAKSSGLILSIIGFFSIYSYLIAISQIPQIITNYIFALTLNKYLILLLINIVLLIAGSLMEAIAILVVSVPILLPIIEIMGINPVHFGIIIVLNLMIGVITPPVGLCLFVVSDIGKISVGQVVKAIWPFLIPLILVLMLVTYCPVITLILPNLIYG